MIVTQTFADTVNRLKLNAAPCPADELDHEIIQSVQHKPNEHEKTSSNDDLVAFGQRHVTAGIVRVTEAVINKGDGSYLNFEDGRRLLDFAAGVGVTNLGHCHPKVCKAAADQCTNLVHGQCGIAFHLQYLRLIEKLLPVMPDPSLDSFFFWNSGSEAIEASIKLARRATGKQNIISMQGGYHGRTYGAMAVTKSITWCNSGFLPLMPGVFSTAFPYWHQLGVPPDTSDEELVRLSLYQLELVLKQQTAPKDTAAILLEPVLGLGGYVPAPAAFLQGVRKVCDEHGILLIIDEIQSGYGRTGKLFNIEYSGVRPDILALAKGMANGFQLSAVVSRKELTDKLDPGSMGGTYAGNPIACAAAAAVVDVIKEEKVLENVVARSEELREALNGLRQDSEVGPLIVHVRGTGLMAAVEFASPSYPKEDPAFNPSAPKKLASRVAKRCMDKGLLILPTSVYETIKFIPPLNITREDFLKGCEIFVTAVKEVVREG